MSNPASVPRAPDVITPESTAAVDAAITSRRSIRRFLPTEVPRSVIEDILRVSARAPSGTNTQPWRVHVLTGASLQALVDRIMAAHNDPAQVGLHQEEYDLYLDFSYQYGVGAWNASSMLKSLRAGNYVQACHGLLEYRKIRRRNAQGSLYLYDCSTPGNKICRGVWTRQVERHNKCMEAQ